jgi:FKBP-type peptidyl-prolyl cis-trans isomerase FkpA
MKQIFLSVCLSAIILTGCEQGFKKTKGNYEYKVVGGGGGSKAKLGQFLQLDFKNWVNNGKGDSILQNTRTTLPQIVKVDSTSPEIYEIYKSLRKGDSAVVRIIADSMFKKMGRDMPPFFKPGKYLYTSIKVINLFENEKDAEAAQNKAEKEAKPKIYKAQIDAIEKDLASKKGDLERDTRMINEYLTKNNIKAAKTTWGTFIDFKNEGTGEKINPGSVVYVNSEGRTLDSGKIFDGNMGRNQPYPVTMSNPTGVIIGWTDALMQMKKGSKATIYIPSSLGYGTQGNGPKIKPNDNLIFDIEVMDVKSEEEIAAKREAEQKEMQAKQQKMMDSMQNAAKMDSLNKIK